MTAGDPLRKAYKAYVGNDAVFCGDPLRMADKAYLRNDANSTGANADKRGRLKKEARGLKQVPVYAQLLGLFYTVRPSN